MLAHCWIPVSGARSPKQGTTTRACTATDAPRATVLCFESSRKEAIAHLRHDKEQELCFPPKNQHLLGHYCDLGPGKMTNH